jgi:hypothetical protein
MIDPRIIFGRLGNQMFQYAALYKLAKDGKTDFYFQDPKWFRGCEDEIKKLFGDGIGYLPYVAVHLRVGGNPVYPEEPKYSDNPFYYNLGKSGYYINATNLFPNRKFLVFSDDMEFAKRYFEGDKFAFDDSPTDLEAFNKMASCDSQIIANSSFSWWAGFLNPNKSKKVVAPGPDKWFADGIKRVGYPQDNWIIL